MKKIFLITFLIQLFLTSCNNEDITKITEIKVKTENDISEVVVGDSFTFIIETDTNQDVTNEAVIKVDGNIIDSNVFITNTIGEINVTAQYNQILSNTKILTASLPSTYSKKLLIEDFTGVWCGRCPRVSYAIGQLKQIPEFADKIVSVGVHLYLQNDLYCFDGSVSLNDDLNIGGLPEGRLNRNEFWNNVDLSNMDLEQATSLISLSAPLGLSIDSQIENNNINATIEVGFDQNFSDDLGIVVYLVENQLIHDQVNYTVDNYGNGNVDPLVDFEHNDVLRSIFTINSGDLIPNEFTTENSFYSFNINESIPNTVANLDKLHLVAFVINKVTGEVINTQEAAVGEFQPFN